MIYIFRMVAVNTEYVYIIYYHELLHIYVLRETRDHRTTTSFVYLASYTSSHSNYENWNNFPNFVSNYIVDEFSNLIIWIEIHPVWFISTYMLYNIHTVSNEHWLFSHFSTYSQFVSCDVWWLAELTNSVRISSHYILATHRTQGMCMYLFLREKMSNAIFAHRWTTSLSNHPLHTYYYAVGWPATQPPATLYSHIGRV